MYSCVACGSGDLSLVHRSCRYIRPLIWEPFTIIPPDLQGWVHGLDDVTILTSIKTHIYKYFLGVELRSEELIWVYIWDVMFLLVMFLLTKLLPEHEMVDLITSITRAVQNQMITITKRHRSKLNYWVNRYNFPESCNIADNQDIKGIINLSSESLTPSENRLLSLGLKFRLPKTPDIPRIISCLEPAIKSLSHQDTFKIRQAVTSILQKPVPHTKESKGLYQTIKKLKQNTSIVITRSDKGSDIVILNTTDYTSKMHDILSNASIFSPITPQDNTTSIRKFRTSLLRLKRSKHISQDQYSTFISNLNSNAYIYGLPKTHKPSVPLRPVIAYHQSPAYAVSKFLSNFLSPILHSKPGTHAITNIPSFIHEITNLKAPKDHIMVSFDVKSLYLSLPHPLIISELKKTFI
ncbi:hypothetical protein LAZ67_1002822 [Cordylochernes scorpioides]|uniref:Reverse transcriptase domain-containing protein n=1 Tax=Cordylochernes scorpioides TaxID=51811 RepID=A0ABY6JWP3_9ARAC|nr:hypothetical protein LAZ67_1002822 [Cordylochernes scorpioides]